LFPKEQVSARIGESMRTGKLVGIQIQPELVPGFLVARRKVA
jgi:hypothetical protein